MLPIGIPYVLGYENLVLPLFIGVILAMFVDALLLYKFSIQRFSQQVLGHQGLQQLKPLRRAIKAVRMQRY